MSVYEELVQRGFVQQVSNEAALRALLEKESITCYIGFDPTATSLHVGNLVQIMVLAHMQRAGHRPIALMGGGTVMIGDPSGRSELRQMLKREQIAANLGKIQEQFARFMSFENDQALLLNNADWLLELNYVEFLRDIGRHFSVNRMLATEAYKTRLETGLTFLEFNYQVLQAYDYLMLYRRHGCALQMGGNDQWGNILPGVDLVRKVENKEVFALTTPLLTTASGQKMGKTSAGAVWLSAEKFKPYDFYQYWINVDDRDVIKLLRMYTFLPLVEIAKLEKLRGAEMRTAKELLAFEVTTLTHGKEEAEKAKQAAHALFSQSGEDGEIPYVRLSAARFAAGMKAVDLFHFAGLSPSKSEARRLIEGGGAYVNRRRMESIEDVITLADLENGALLLRAGKKRYQRVIIDE